MIDVDLVDCWSQSIVDLIQLLISVNCWSFLIVNLSQLLISVNCWSQSTVNISQLSISVNFWSQSIVNFSQLLISVHCQSQLIWLVTLDDSCKMLLSAENYKKKDTKEILLNIFLIFLLQWVVADITIYLLAFNHLGNKKY